MDITFDNLVDTNGKPLVVEVPDDFDVAHVEEAGRAGREAAERFTAMGLAEDK